MKIAHYYRQNVVTGEIQRNTIPPWRRPPITVDDAWEMVNEWNRLAADTYRLLPEPYGGRSPWRYWIAP